MKIFQIVLLYILLPGSVFCESTLAQITPKSMSFSVSIPITIGCSEYSKPSSPSDRTWDQNFDLRLSASNSAPTTYYYNEDSVFISCSGGISSPIPHSVAPGELKLLFTIDTINNVVRNFTIYFYSYYSQLYFSESSMANIRFSSLHFTKSDSGIIIDAIQDSIFAKCEQVSYYLDGKSTNSSGTQGSYGYYSFSSINNFPEDFIIIVSLMSKETQSGIRPSVFNKDHNIAILNFIDGNIILSVPTLGKDMVLDVFDVLGRKVYSTTLLSYQKQLTLPRALLSYGHYFAKVGTMSSHFFVN
jgi:hypothetical protein